MKKELTTLRLWNPLFPNIYRKNEWGDVENDLVDLTAGEILEYEDKILDLIEREGCSMRVSVVLLFTSMTTSAERYTASALLWRNGTVNCGALPRCKLMATCLPLNFPN